MNKEFCCDCNVIHEDVVNDAISKMPDRAVLDEVANFLRYWECLQG